MQKLGRVSEFSVTKGEGGKMQLYGKCMERQHVNNRAGQLKKRSSKMEINWNIKTHNACYNHTYTVSLIKSVFIPTSCSHSVAFLKPSLRSLQMCLFLIRSLSHHFFLLQCTSTDLSLLLLHFLKCHKDPITIWPFRGRGPYYAIVHMQTDGYDAFSQLLSPFTLALKPNHGGFKAVSSCCSLCCFIILTYPLQHEFILLGLSLQNQTSVFPSV